jgi:8-oxo-dGTP pyrophosphatase MutT (NUDIX family)
MGVNRGFEPMSKMQPRRVYRGKIIDLEIEEAKLPDGRCVALEMVHHPGGAATVALDAEARVCLLRQYRHVAKDWLWELPAGKLDPGETPLRTAQRELAEEAGLNALAWDALGAILSSPGVFTEMIHLFLAHDLVSLDASNHEEHELIEVHWVPLVKALHWCDSGVIRDAKTLVGLYRAGTSRSVSRPSSPCSPSSWCCSTPFARRRSSF